MSEGESAIGLSSELGDAVHRRWVPPPEADLEREIQRRLQGRVQLLVALPDLELAIGQVQMAERVARVLGRSGAVELDGAARPRSIWTTRAWPGDVARALDDAAMAVRRTGATVAWRVGPEQADPEHVDALRRRELLLERDALLVDVRRLTPDEIEGVVRRLDPVLMRRQVWLLGGVDSTHRGSDVDEIARWQHARSLATARVYWSALPKGPVARIAERIGLDAAVRFDRMRAGADGSDARVLVTGGAGFVGSNLTAALARRGQRVVVLDDLRRPGVERNLAWLEREHGRDVEVVLGDVRCAEAVRYALRDVHQVFHLAGQVAVTSSLADPTEDFDINARGTLVLLEEIRRLPKAPGLVFTSTNKVYGNLASLPLEEQASRYTPADPHLRMRGIDEAQPLDLHSPYGCSKGSGDQYVLDYAESFGISSVVFRMSCIYGPRQFGTEDQGWVAHFVRAALRRERLTIYGDGKQVRDVLHVADLVNAFLLAAEHIERLRGRAFNIGGGPENTLSLLELVDRIEMLVGHRPDIGYAPWRRGDQPYYVSDTTRFRTATEWTPTVNVERGLQSLLQWLVELEGPTSGIRPGAFAAVGR